MSLDDAIHIRPATMDDIAALHPVIERAYRGDSARIGWSHEADLLTDPRIGKDDLLAIIENPQSCLLMAERSGAPIGCVQVSRIDESRAYMGLLCIEPTLQAAGLGRQLIAVAEHHARDMFACTLMTMNVIETRIELIDYYIRRGYTPSGRRLDFPVPLDPPYFMTELVKTLA